MTTRGDSPFLPSLLREKTCCYNPCTAPHDPPPPPRHAHPSSGGVRRDPRGTPSPAASAALCLPRRGDARSPAAPPLPPAPPGTRSDAAPSRSWKKKFPGNLPASYPRRRAASAAARSPAARGRAQRAALTAVSATLHPFLPAHLLTTPAVISDGCEKATCHAEGLLLPSA